MLKKLWRTIRMDLLRARCEMLGDLEFELEAAGIDTHRVRRLRVDAALKLDGLEVQALQERVSIRSVWGI
jgi:hypothetical protein